MAVKWNEAAVTAVVKQAAMAGVVSGVQVLHSSMVEKIMNPPKTGRIYPRKKTRIFRTRIIGGGYYDEEQVAASGHQASAPGEAPANDLGNLVASIREEYEPDRLRGFVVVSAPYAAALEFGALRMALGGYWELEPRPYAAPSVAENREAIQVEIQRNIRAAIDKYSRRAKK